MQRKYGPQGLVVMSVSVEEEAQDMAHQEKVLAFLKKQNATFPNYVLVDEKPDNWIDKLGSGLRPIVFVFNKDGRWRSFNGTDLGEDDGDAKLDALIQQWLKQK
jgi:hypothetical protein